MLLEARFFPLEGFPRVYLVSSLMGMLSILLHVDVEYFTCMFQIWVMWKLSFYGCIVSLQFC